MFGGIGWGEGLFIFFIILLLFGAKRIPDVARSMGSAVSQFKKGMRGEVDAVKKELDETGPDGDKKP